jgi:hypothetical protein
LKVSTVLTLVVVPTIYTLFAANGIKRQDHKLKKLAALKKKDEESIL